MQKFMALILLLLATGCSTTQIRSGDAICDGTQTARANLARALLADGGNQSVVAGQALLAQLQAACR